MKKAALYSIVIIVSGLVVLGCATAGHGNSVRDTYVPAENPLIGEWQEGEQIYTFKPDGTFTIRQDGHGGHKPDGRDIPFIYDHKARP